MKLEDVVVLKDNFYCVECSEYFPKTKEMYCLVQPGTNVCGKCYERKYKNNVTTLWDGMERRGKCKN